MTQDKKLKTGIAVAATLIVAYLFFVSPDGSRVLQQPLDTTPKNVTLSGVFTCLPHTNTSGPQTMECAFGMKTDEGAYYAVNFGESASAMQQFQSGAHITAEGFVVSKEALNTDQWNRYNMKGIFTVTRVLQVGADGRGLKINIEGVCRDALSYMTFPAGSDIEGFVRACVRGEHPEVIEQYKARLGVGLGASI